MDKIEIKARRGEYDFSSMYSSSIPTYLKPLVTWFIQTIYEEDEKFVERNINNVNEENNAPKKRK